MLCQGRMCRAGPRISTSIKQGRWGPDRLWRRSPSSVTSWLNMSWPTFATS